MDSDELDFTKLSVEELQALDPEELMALLSDFTGSPVGDPTNPIYYVPPPHPFFDALANQETSPDEIENFLNNGVDPNETRQGQYSQIEHPLLLVAKNGNVNVAKLLIDRGANVNFVDHSNYSPLLNACYMPAELGEDRVVQMVKLLLDNGGDPNVASIHGESPIRVCAQAGHFEVVKVLLARGASPTPLAWNGLMNATVLGTLSEVKATFGSYPDVELRDSTGCTALMLALKLGDIEKAEALLQYGASPNSIPNSIEEPLHCAIQSGSRKMVEYFLSIKAEYNPHGYHDRGPFAVAIDTRNREIVEFLIQAYSHDPSFQKYLDTALYDDEDGNFARFLLESGANPDNIRRLARRTVLGHKSFGHEELAKITKVQYLEGRSPYFGKTNPELVNQPYWLAMIRIGCSGYDASRHFGEESNFVCGAKDPVWCADRFGQSITFLPDGRIIEIGGEHEDSYDPDFCIYNDVFVHHPDGTTDIYCYPRADFPPTDFHSAKLVGEWIYIVGCLGYHGERQGEYIPVFRLNIDSLQIEQVETQNSPRFQVYSHLAKLIDGDKIQISGGKRLSIGKKKPFTKKESEVFEPNSGSYILDIESRKWYTASVLGTKHD